VKNCLITGATSGIGRMTALGLGGRGMNLILVGRNRKAGLSLARRLAKVGTVEFLRTDLSEQAQVRELARNLRNRVRSLDVLINNAGARHDVYRQTGDELERTFATNHLGHFLLTCELLDLLAQAPAARVITVGSSAHLSADARSDWYYRRDNYDRRAAYAKSKLANLMFAYELARRLRDTNITSNAVDPGSVATNFARNNGIVPWVRHLTSSVLRRHLVSARTAAETVVHLAVSSELDGVSGRYFYRNRQVGSSAASMDDQQAQRLWELSVELTGLNRGDALSPLARSVVATQETGEPSRV
jgi:NAD(P)-dependent dehydrogenase (short-subunit alcohol dehydrogenase family)